MSTPMRDGINFAKIVTILAIVFGVSLGLCGLTVVAADRWSGLIALGVIEVVAMVLSAAGIVAMGSIWVLVSIFGESREQETGLQKLFEDEKRDRK
jgi:uncharacterized membrane protein